MAKIWPNRYTFAKSTKFGTYIVQVNGIIPDGCKGRGQGQIKVTGQNGVVSDCCYIIWPYFEWKVIFLVCINPPFT